MSPPVYPPIIVGTAPGQIVYEGNTLAPFRQVVITDPNAAQSDTATVTLNQITGLLVDPNAATDGSTYDATTGVYTISGSAAFVTAAIDGLEFTPYVYTLGATGSVATIFTIAISDTAGQQATDSGTTVISKIPIIAQDFIGDGRSSLVAQNVDGAIDILDTSPSGLQIATAESAGDPGPTWHVVSTADFNGDGQPDMLLQNDNGTIVDYLMDGAGVAATHDLGSAGPSWHVRGTGNFTGTGGASILLQDDSGGMALWETNGTSVTGTVNLGALPAGWAVEGVADFTGSGQADILAQSTSGALVIYTMSGTSIVAGAELSNPGSGWTVAGTGDYNGDGKADIVLHNDNGLNVVWEMNGPTVIGTASLGNPGIGFSEPVTGLDFNGDGVADLAVQDVNTQAIVGYEVNDNAQITSGSMLGAPGNGWQVIGNNPMTFIDGTGARLALTGTAGPDEFNFTSFVAGLHTVSGFDAAIDAVALSLAVFPNYAAVQTHEAAYMGGTFIGLSSSAAVVIQGVSPSHLSAADFVLR